MIEEEGGGVLSGVELPTIDDYIFHITLQYNYIFHITLHYIFHVELPMIDDYIFHVEKLAEEFSP